MENYKKSKQHEPHENHKQRDQILKDIWNI